MTPNPRLLRCSYRYTRTICIGVGLLSLVVLLDWTVGGLALSRVLLGLEEMRANAALGLLLASVSLWCLHQPRSAGRGWRWLGYAGAIGAGVTGAATLAEHLLGRDLGVSGLLVPAGPARELLLRPSAIAATALCVIAAGLLLVDAPTRRRYAATEWLALLAFFIGLVASLGHLYDASRLYRVSATNFIALHTGIAISLLAIGLLTARPERGVMRSVADDGPAGLLLRRLLPTAVVLPVLLGWLFFYGQRATSLDVGLGLAVMVTANVAVFGGLLLHAALVIERADAGRQLAQIELRQANDVLEQRVAARTAELHERNLVLQREIAERRKAEESFRAVVETASDAIVSANADGVITYFNSAAERLFGYSAADAIGRPLTVLMPARFHAAHQQGLQRFLATRHARVIGRTLELTGCRRSGAEFPLELSLAAWQVGDDIYFTGILRDVSERRQSQARIEQLNESLSQRTQELEALNRELEAFSYSVSHDLRAPLRSIDGFSLALLEDYGANLDSAGRDYLQRVRHGAQRMGQLIDDLLKLSRISRADIQPRAVDLSDMVHAIAAELTERERQRQVEFRVTADISAHCDPNLMQVALTNLLANAWKFTATRSPATIEFGATTTDAGVPVYYVRDNGVGFDMNYVDKLFGAFQRLHGTHEFPGSGIGLATVQRVIHKHGGRVWAEAGVGQGATFYFTLPTSEREAA